jgi:hypothetical protein
VLAKGVRQVGVSWTFCKRWTTTYFWIDIFFQRTPPGENQSHDPKLQFPQAETIPLGKPQRLAKAYFMYLDFEGNLKIELRHKTTTPFPPFQVRQVPRGPEPS